MKKLLLKIASILGFGKKPATPAADLFIDVDIWDENGGSLDWPDLRGRKCFGGLDWGAGSDSCCLALYFPPRADDCNHRVLLRYLATRGGERGLEESAKRLGDLYSVQSVGFDPWEGTNLAHLLEDAGFFTIGVRQGFSGLDAPLKMLRELVLRRELKHGGDPSLRKAISRFVVASAAFGGSLSCISPWLSRCTRTRECPGSLAMNKHARDIVGTLGFALVALGAGMIYRPAGVLVAGVLLTFVALFGFASDKPKKKVGD